MRTNFRALNVEHVEDRSLPSSYFMFTTPSPSHFTPANDHPYVTFATATFETRGITTDGRIVNLRFVEPVLVIHEPYGFGGYGGFNGSQPPQQPPVVVGVNEGPADSGTSSAGGSVGNGPVINQPHVVAHNPTTTPTTDVSIVVPTEATNGMTPAQAGQAAAVAVQTAALQATQIQVITTAPITTGRVAGYANTAIIGPSDDIAVPAPGPSVADPLPGPTTPPVSGSEAAVSPVTDEPISGLIPIDFSTLKATASQFLDRVADLAPAWPDGMPALSDSIWMAAIGLLGGGAIYAATNRPARPARDVFGSASALSEWERRNARSAG